MTIRILSMGSPSKKSSLTVKPVKFKQTLMQPLTNIWQGAYLKSSAQAALFKCCCLTVKFIKYLSFSAWLKYYLKYNDTI